MDSNLGIRIDHNIEKNSVETQDLATELIAFIFFNLTQIDVPNTIFHAFGIHSLAHKE